MTAGGSGAVRNVAASHAAVVTPIVRSSRCQKANDSAKTCGPTICRKTAQMIETPRATISVQALMRIQNQRSRKTAPVPAPTMTIRSKPAFASARSGARSAPATMSAIDVQRATATSSCAFADGWTKRFQTSCAT